MRKQTEFTLILLIICSVFTGCSSDEELRQRAEAKRDAYAVQSLTRVGDAITRLNQHLLGGNVRNAKLLKQYAKEVKAIKPEMAELVDLLTLDSTSEGPLFNSLVQRFEDAKDTKQFVIKGDDNDLVVFDDELTAIYNAASPVAYGHMLTDPINVLADMSDGRLGRVEAMSKEASLAKNGSEDLGVGSQMVGNPNYGRWENRSNGTSFWAFYGQYRLLGDLMGRRVDYGHWSRHRDYSYYNDRGRANYTSPSQRTTQVKTENIAKKKFSREGKKFNSPYAKSKASSNSPPPRSVTKAPSKFQSSFSKRNSTSSSNRTSNTSSSTYNSRNMGSTSRSSRGGK
ncbi:MAG: hypothetical protein ACI93R_002878 [Flavobacteriales bacterium]|jgi:hypothetical protein